MDNPIVHLRPARPGLRVVDPRDRDKRGRMRPLPEDGKRVRLTQYWMRRLADGDVVEGKAKAKAKAKETKA